MPRRTVLRRLQRVQSLGMPWMSTAPPGAIWCRAAILRRATVLARMSHRICAAPADALATCRVPFRDRFTPRWLPPMASRTCSRRRRDANHSQRFGRVKPIPASRAPSTPVFREVFFNRPDALRRRLARRDERPQRACARCFAIVRRRARNPCLMQVSATSLNSAQRSQRRPAARRAIAHDTRARCLTRRRSRLFVARKIRFFFVVL